jgi:hypothetical protein
VRRPPRGDGPGAREVLRRPSGATRSACRTSSVGATVPASQDQLGMRRSPDYCVATTCSSGSFRGSAVDWLPLSRGGRSRRHVPFAAMPPIGPLSRSSAWTGARSRRREYRAGLLERERPGRRVSAGPVRGDLDALEDLGWEAPAGSARSGDGRVPS